MRLSRAAFLAGLLLPSALAAQTNASGEIVVAAPWLRATPKNASVAGGYATITNKAATPDRLLGASLPMAPDGQIHSMSMTNGIMRMQRLDKGLPIAAGATLRLTPDGYHLMFANPKTQLREGETVAGSLLFEKAGRVAVTFSVAGFGAKAAPATGTDRPPHP